MKTFLLLIILIPTITFSQWYEEYPYTTYLNFDTELNLEYVYCDTVSNPACIWQIASPNKVVFTEANSEPNVMVTDSTNSYPINDTSSFIVFHEITTGFDYGSGLEAAYFMDSDHGNDFGKIEMSPDNGASWVLISDDTLTYVDWDGEPATWPVDYYDTWGATDSISLTGESVEWQIFFINLEGANEHFDWVEGDTVLFKFTFISDSIFDDKDGLMFDDIVLRDLLTFGINEESNITFNVYPNPTTEIIYLSDLSAEVERIEVFDMQGRRIYYSNTELNFVDVSDLPSGSYHLKIFTPQGAALKPFIKQ